jgi:hypothetical protein
LLFPFLAGPSLAVVSARAKLEIRNAQNATLIRII